MFRPAPSRCPAEPCIETRVPGAPLCRLHMQLVPRPTLCALRRAWHDGDTARIERWAQRAVDDVQVKLDALAAAAEERMRAAGIEPPH